MTPDEIEKDRAPERIWAFHAGPLVGYFIGKPEYGTNVAEYLRADLAAERERKLVEALKHLDRAATEVIRYGAQTGPQWTRITAASIKARAALQENCHE